MSFLMWKPLKLLAGTRQTFWEHQESSWFSELRWFALLPFCASRICGPRIDSNNIYDACRLVQSLHYTLNIDSWFFLGLCFIGGFKFFLVQWDDVIRVQTKLDSSFMHFRVTEIWASVLVVPCTLHRGVTNNAGPNCYRHGYFSKGDWWAKLWVE